MKKKKKKSNPNQKKTEKEMYTHCKRACVRIKI